MSDSKGKGHDLGPPGIAAFTSLLKALSERGSAVGVTNAAGVANFKQLWDDLEPVGALDMVTHCKLAKVYDPALCRLEFVISAAEHREHIRGAIGQTGANRLLGTGRGNIVSARTSQLNQVNFMAASRPDSPKLPLSRCEDWRQSFASDSALMARALGRLSGTVDSLVSSTSGQLPSSAEIEEVRGHSCGALDLEFNAEEEVVHELYSQRDL